METELRNWHLRLEQHFAGLRDRRCINGSERPIFGLEHGLDDFEVEAVAKAAREHIMVCPPSNDHALAWIVYSSELGYRYSGDEYWQTFELETPGWSQNGDRNWIRDCYRQFHKDFGGAVPSGAWAEHFSIICWPITHAILPKDLQRQLARILYELRHSFSGDLLASPEMLGEVIAARSWNTTSRFQNLTQETKLVGQIAAALLLEEESSSDTLIHAATLSRIGNDLDLERRAREWLRGARRFAKKRALVRGLGILGRSTKSTINRPDEARAEVAALGLEPRLVLRPTDSQRQAWEASIEIPDMSHLLLRFPWAQEILTGSRCIVAGASGRPLARGRCLHGAQRITLARWPQASEVLLQFEQTDAQLEYLLRTECLLRPGPFWLFRIASDGLAYESRSLRVRPGERYILVNVGGQLVSTDHGSSVNLQCDGAVGTLLDLPSALTPDWEETLRRLGLGQAKTIDVWPAGLAAVVWDGEGHGEWLASEQPCLAICVDHPIDGLLVSMGDGLEPPLELTSISPGVPLFIELPQLPVGLHRVRISVRTSPGMDAETLGDLDVVMRIREARPWSPGVSPNGPLLVQMEPTEPSLEQMWEGHAEITIRGPAGRNVACTVSLFEREGKEVTASKKLPPIRLPVSAEAWRNHLDKHFRGIKNIEEAYDTARFCDLVFTADELGTFTLRCEREFTPLRWALRRKRDSYIVRLLDDSGCDEQPTITRLSFETPVIEEPTTLASHFEAPRQGGMYVAQLPSLTAAIIVPPVVRGLEDLGCSPRVDFETRSLGSITHTIAIADLWHRAKLPGELFSATRKREVLLALTSHITRLICGENWARVEMDTQRIEDSITRLREAVTRHTYDAAIGEALEQDCAEFAAKTCRDCVQHLAWLGIKFQLLPSASRAEESDAIWLSELALRLASDVGGVKAWAGERLRAGLTWLMDPPTLARAARFFVLSASQHRQSQAGFGELYSGWDWK